MMNSLLKFLPLSKYTTTIYKQVYLFDDIISLYNVDVGIPGDTFNMTHKPTDRIILPQMTVNYLFWLSVSVAK